MRYLILILSLLIVGPVFATDCHITIPLDMSKDVWGNGDWRLTARDNKGKEISRIPSTKTTQELSGTISGCTADSFIEIEARLNPSQTKPNDSKPILHKAFQGYVYYSKCFRDIGFKDIDNPKVNFAPLGDEMHPGEGATSFIYNQLNPPDCSTSK